MIQPKIRRSQPRGGGLLMAAALAVAAVGVAAPRFFGDTNEDETINVADVVGIVNAIQPGATPSAREQLLADANADGTLDGDDAAYAIDVTLQLADPVPLLLTSTTAVVSFWHREDPASLPVVESNARQEEPASFWRRQMVEVQFTERDTIFEKPASFWRIIEDIQVTERDTVFEHPASFWRQIGSFFATEDNAFLEAPASFERMVE